MNQARGAFVAVEGDRPAIDADPAAPARERSATRRHLHEASRRAVIAALPLPGALLLAVWPLAMWSLAQRGAGAWGWMLGRRWASDLIEELQSRHERLAGTPNEPITTAQAITLPVFGMSMRTTGLCVATPTPLLSYDYDHD